MYNDTYNNVEEIMMRMYIKTFCTDIANNFNAGT